MTRIVFLFIASLFFIFAADSAQAADPFTVAAVRVDATADTAIDAQLKATEAGQIRAAQLLVERLTLPSERAAKGLPEITIDTARAMIRGQSIGNEKRSSRRYLGDITVAFNPSRVQTFLRENGFTMVATQSRDSLVLPILNGGSPWADNDWVKAWQDGAYEHALTPVKSVGANVNTSGLVTASQALGGNKGALSQTARQFELAQVLIARASGGAGGVSVTISDYAVDTDQSRSIGTVNAANFTDAARATVQLLEDNWKEASVVRAENAKTMVVSVLYNSLEDWMTLQSVINNSAQIQDARLDALSKDGAMMTLTFGGDMDRLANELAFKGVQINTDPKIGTYLARSNFRL
ncbi:DUF2066 domain-containing protein [Fretibacter rubidus]|uniref:DUF2066 domain-containing protein n=1 Tax=Fretibacter rubidus TaxID=570162 RepID=UPI00352A9A43